MCNVYRFSKDIKAYYTSTFGYRNAFVEAKPVPKVEVTDVTYPRLCTTRDLHRMNGMGLNLGDLERNRPDWLFIC